MKITNQGVDMSVTPVPMRSRCVICDTGFECDSTEAKRKWFKYIGWQFYIECPTCKHPCRLEKLPSKGETIGGIIAVCIVFSIFVLPVIFCLLSK